MYRAGRTYVLVAIIGTDSPDRSRLCTEGVKKTDRMAASVKSIGNLFTVFSVLVSWRTIHFCSI